MTRLPPDPYYVLRSHLGGVTALCFVEDPYGVNQELSSVSSPYLLSGSDIGEIFLWDLKINRVVCRLNQQDEKMVMWLNFYHKKIISQIRETGIRIWSYVDEKWSITDTIAVKDVGFCPSDLFISTINSYWITPGPRDSCLSVIDFKTKHVISILEPNDTSSGMCMYLKVFLIKQKEYVLCGYENGTIVLWDCQKTCSISSLQCHKEPVMCLDFDANGKHSGISGSADDHLQLWKLDDELKLSATGKVKLTNPGVASISIRPDGKIVIVGCWDSYVRVYSWKTMKPLAALKFHISSINCLRFSPKSIGKKENVFATGSKDKNISLWSIY